FEGPDVHQELLYDIIRPYGRITSMTKPTPVPAGSLRFVTVTFSRIRPAILAKNCLYGIGVADTTLSTAGTATAPTKTRLMFTYERPLKAHWVRDWMSSHPRIVLPIVAFLLGGLTYTIFDPIRSFFIKSKVMGYFEYQDWRIVKFFRKNVYQKLSFHIVPAMGSSTSAKDSSDTSTSETSPDNKKAPPSSIASAAGEWKERQDAEQALLMYLVDSPSTVAVLHGPQGSGKSKMLAKVLSLTSQLSQNQAASEPRKTVVIDCTEIYKAGTDAGIVTSLAAQTGYWPVFSFLSSMNNMIDLASVGLIGQKAGFSTTVEEQMKEILEVTAGALAQVSEDLKGKIEKEKKANPSKPAKIVVPPTAPAPAAATSDDKEVGAAVVDGKEEGKEGSLIGKAVSNSVNVVSNSVTAVSSSVSAVGSAVQSGVAGASHEFQGLLDKAGLSGDKKEDNKEDIDWALSAHNPGGVPRILDESVNALPVVILSNFAAKNAGKKEDLLDVVAGWAASLVENKIAHVIVISDGRENMRRLAKALPSKPLLSISLGDADPATAMAFVRSKITALGPTQSLTPEDEAWIEKLGGRASDLDTLIHKVQNGLNVRDAVQTIVAQGVGELRKAAFGDDVDDAKDLPWKPEQAWSVLKALAKHDELSYAEVLLEFPFKGDEAALRAMEHAELISINATDGLPISIKPGKPIYRYVFQRLVNDNIFRAVQDIAYNNKAIAAEEATIKKCEEELLTLKTIGLDVGSSVFGGTGATGSRATYLLGKMRDSQEKIVVKEKEVKRLKVVLSTLGAEPPKA
ncbi:mitochondrial escape protein 2, partial [Tulasnella sp. 427]